MLSKYEEDRLAKIARNKAMMESLGIERVKEKKQKKVVTKKTKDAPVRRSARVQAEFEKTEALNALARIQENSTRRRSQRTMTRNSHVPNRYAMSPDSADDRDSIDLTADSPIKHKIKLSPDYLDGIPTFDIPSMAKSVLTLGYRSKDLELVVPSDNHIGSVLYPVGKLATMLWLCPGYHPRFSLMQSHQEWKNGLVIFINVDLNDRYTNVFERKEDTNQLMVTWFARASLAEDHPVIQQLIQGPKSGLSLREEEPTHDECTLLFFRFGQGPYVYGGRLGYMNHDTEKYESIRFQFELMDASRYCDALNDLLLKQEEPEKEIE